MMSAPLFLDDAVESPLKLDDLSTSPDGAAHRALVYRALYDYDPREASPNIDSEIELTFSRGDLINIYGSVDEDGFFRGELDGQYGLVPSNFVQRLSNSVSPDKSSGRSTPARVLKEDPLITSSTTSTASSEKTKKRGMFSKGKRLFRRLGSTEKPRK